MGKTLQNGILTTTQFRTLFHDLDKVMTGNEVYPIVGEQPEGIILSRLEKKISEVIKSFAGMNRGWDCLRKAFMTSEFFKGGVVTVGSMFIDSIDGKSNYGFAFDPPLELHAWVQGPNGIIVDCALPGVIEMGIKSCDQYGPYIVGREPCILFGRPLEWMHYQAKEVIKK